MLHLVLAAAAAPWDPALNTLKVEIAGSIAAVATIGFLVSLAVRAIASHGGNYQATAKATTAIWISLGVAVLSAAAIPLIAFAQSLGHSFK